jgi:hypothetical protein
MLDADDPFVTAVAAAAVDVHTDQTTRSSCDLNAIGRPLDALLYGYGGDRVDVLSAESLPGCLTVLGWGIWVPDGRIGPLEATFELDETKAAVRAFTVRAGDARVLERDAPGLLQLESWRAQSRFLAARPTADEHWVEVIHYDLTEPRLGDAQGGA